MKTAQEFFDLTIEHLHTMRHRAISKSGGCVYRTSGGLKCAVGAHLPDYDGLAYQGSVKDLLQTHPWLFEDTLRVEDFNGDIRKTLDFWSHLQAVHDLDDNWDETGWIDNEHIKYVAEKFGLTYTPKQRKVTS